jgi:hypothetical protein
VLAGTAEDGVSIGRPLKYRRINGVVVAIGLAVRSMFGIGDGAGVSIGLPWK